MLTTTLATLAAVAALNAHDASASTTSAVAHAAPANVTAIAVPAKTEAQPKARIPGTFALNADGDPLEGVQALYLVRTGDGA